MENIEDIIRHDQEMIDRVLNTPEAELNKPYEGYRKMYEEIKQEYLDGKRTKEQFIHRVSGTSMERFLIEDPDIEYEKPAKPVKHKKKTIFKKFADAVIEHNEELNKKEAAKKAKEKENAYKTMKRNYLEGAYKTERLFVDSAKEKGYEDFLKEDPDINFENPSNDVREIYSVWLKEQELKRQKAKDIAEADSAYIDKLMSM